MLEPNSDNVLDVEIIYPQFYVDYNIATMKKYSRGIACLCKGAAVLGDDDTEFLVYGITVLQTAILEEVFRRFGIEMEHEHATMPDGTRWTYFYADLRGLKKRMNENEDEESDFEEEWE